MRRGLKDQVDQIVYSCDFPWQIDCSQMLGKVDAPDLRRPICSLTGATYLNQFVEATSLELLELNTNFYFPPARDRKPAPSTATLNGRQQMPVSILAVGSISLPRN